MGQCAESLSILESKCKHKIVEKHLCSATRTWYYFVDVYILQEAVNSVDVPCSI